MVSSFYNLPITDGACCQPVCCACGTGCQQTHVRGIPFLSHPLTSSKYNHSTLFVPFYVLLFTLHFLVNTRNCLGSKRNHLGSNRRCLGDERNHLGSERRCLGNSRSHLGDERNSLGGERRCLVSNRSNLVNNRSNLGRNLNYFISNFNYLVVCFKLFTLDVRSWGIDLYNSVTRWIYKLLKNFRLWQVSKKLMRKCRYQVRRF